MLFIIRVPYSDARAQQRKRCAAIFRDDGPLFAFGMAIHPIQIEAQAPSRLVTLIFRVFAAISHAFVVHIFCQIRDFGKLCCGVSV